MIARSGPSAHGMKRSMPMNFGGWVCLISFASAPLLASDPPVPAINAVTVTNAQKALHFTPYPAAQQYKILQTDRLERPFVEDASGSFSGYDWIAPIVSGLRFYRLQIFPL